MYLMDQLAEQQIVNHLAREDPSQNTFCGQALDLNDYDAAGIVRGLGNRQRLQVQGLMLHRDVAVGIGGPFQVNTALPVTLASATSRSTTTSSPRATSSGKTGTNS